MSDTLWVSEVFQSIQGEGFRTGLPATFVRLAGCNLRCPNCDTPKSLDHSEAHEIPLEDLVKEIPPTPSNIIITGGEPLLQAKPLQQFVTLLHERLYQVATETNGTQRWNGMGFDWITVSPKTMDVEWQTFRPWPREIKLPVGSAFRIIEMLRIIPIWLWDRICLQPWEEEGEDNTKRALEMCLSMDLRLSIQLHKILGVR